MISVPSIAQTISPGNDTPSVPTFATQQFVVPANTQILFSEMIDLDSQELILDGTLIEVQ